MTQPEDIIDFWFDKENTAFWFKKSEAFDATLSAQFKETLDAAARGELFQWRQSHEGRLAEIIVLDQFSRNIFRDTASAFAQDALALVLSQEAITRDVLASLSESQRNFLLMPFMHSESPLIHQQAVSLFKSNSSPQTLEFELRHKAIIDRFGRYPHRNAILGRASTAQEEEFLQQPGSSF